MQQILAELEQGLQQAVDEILTRHGLAAGEVKARLRPCRHAEIGDYTSTAALEIAAKLKGQSGKALAQEIVEFLT